MTHRSRGITVLLYLIGILFGLFIIAPLAWVVMLSLKTQLDAFAYPPLFIFRPTIEHYIAIFQDEIFVSAIRNSLIIALWFCVYVAPIGCTSYVRHRQFDRS